jgi:glutathione peroxidase
MNGRVINMSIYDFKFNSIDNEPVNLEDYKGKVLLIVNTASKCGFTPQYEGLEELYKKYNDKGFEILGFPSNQFAEQEPGTNTEIKNFCLINFGVTFPLFEKTDVRGETVNPLFKYLTDKAPFKGFDLSNPNAKMLSDYINSNHSDFMEGNSIKWNFTKFLVDSSGNVVSRFESPIEPLSISSEVEKLLR